MFDIYTEFLDHRPNVQHCRYLCEGIDPDAVLPCLSDKGHADCLLDYDHRPGHIWHLGRPERISELHPCGKILGSHYSWILYRYEGTLVLQRQHAYFYRYCDSGHASACLAVLGSSSTTEVSTHGNLRGRWIVSLTSYLSVY